jgi:hypothetical protein
LVRSAGQSLSKEQVIVEAWNDRAISDNALTVSIARLRRLLQEYGTPRESIQTVYGHGYRFTRRVTSYVRKVEPAPSVELRALQSDEIGVVHRDELVEQGLLALDQEARNHRTRFRWREATQVGHVVFGERARRNARPCLR